MPRSRGTEGPQKPSPRGPPHLRIAGSDSDPSHHRPITDRSPKIGERRSPRGSQSEPVTQKKLGTRIADLESQLGQAQDELKNLKEQLASAEAAKKEAQEKLEKKSKKPAVSATVEVKEKISQTKNQESNGRGNKPSDEGVDVDQLEETDVFEVPIEKTTIEPKPEPTPQANDDGQKDYKANDVPAEPALPTEQEKSTLQELALKDDEIKTLKAKLEEKDKEAESLGWEKETLKTQLSEAASEVSSARAKEEEMALKLRRVEEELETSKTNAARVNDQLKFVEEAKESMEAEMKKIRVQTEQWRKAADAAAAVLSGGMDMNGRVPERCGSMDKHFIGGFGPQSGAGGYGSGFMGSPTDDMDDGFGSGKRKGSGIKMFGDLWRKKGQK